MNDRKPGIFHTKGEAAATILFWAATSLVTGALLGLVALAIFIWLQNL